MARWASLSTETVEQVTTLAQAGQNPHRIAIALGLPDGDVRRVLKARGLYRGGARHGYSVDRSKDPQPEEWGWCRWPGCKQERRPAHGLCYAHEKIAVGLIR